MTLNCLDTSIDFSSFNPSIVWGGPYTNQHPSSNITPMFQCVPEFALRASANNFRLGGWSSSVFSPCLSQCSSRGRRLLNPHTDSVSKRHSLSSNNSQALLHHWPWPWQSHKATPALEGLVARTITADCDPTAYISYIPKRKCLFPALEKDQQSRSHKSICYARN